jgi:hypothetical protein
MALKLCKRSNCNIGVEGRHTISAWATRQRADGGWGPSQARFAAIGRINKAIDAKNMQKLHSNDKNRGPGINVAKQDERVLACFRIRKCRQALPYAKNSRWRFYGPSGGVLSGVEGWRHTNIIIMNGAMAIAK